MVSRAITFLMGILCLLNTGCPSRQPVRKIELTLPQIKDGETSVYEIAAGETVLYRSETRVHFSEELTNPAGSAAPVPTLELTTTVYTVAAPLYFYDSSVVILRRDVLTPLRSARFVTTDVGQFEIQSHYEQTHVRITKRSIDGTETQQFRLAPNSLDNEMIPFVLRGMSLEPSTRLNLSIVLPLSMRIVPAEARVLGTKLVSTRLGDIMCREVELSMQGGKVRLWYELASPRRLVMLFNPDRHNELRLVAYHPGEDSVLP